MKDPGSILYGWIPMMAITLKNSGAILRYNTETNDQW